MEVTNQTLSHLQNWREFQGSEEGKRLFPGTSSFAWFLRQHREELIRSGGLVKIRGQLHLVRPAFDDAVITVLQAKALNQLVVSHG